MESKEQRLEDVENMEHLQRLEIDNDTEIFLSVVVSKPEGEYRVVEEVGIGKEELKKILDSIGYGGIGWERYNIVEKKEDVSG